MEDNLFKVSIRIFARLIVLAGKLIVSPLHLAGLIAIYSWYFSFRVFYWINNRQGKYMTNYHNIEDLTKQTLKWYRV